MGLDQYATVMLVVPYKQNAYFAPQIITKINTQMLNLADNQSHSTPRLQIAEPLDFNAEEDQPLSKVINSKGTNYTTPVFQLNYDNNDYLSRKYWDLADYILLHNRPKLNADDLKTLHQFDVEPSDNKELAQMHHFINQGGIYVDITDDIGSIIHYVRGCPEEEKLVGLLEIQQLCQTALNNTATNLNAIIAYSEWY